MALFSCPHCARLLQLESRLCSRCRRTVAFDAESNAFFALDPSSGRWMSAGRQPTDARLCDNGRLGVCNWLTRDPGGRCVSCARNRTIPDLTIRGVLGRWRKVEDAKRRAILGILRLGLPVVPAVPGDPVLAFDLLHDEAAEAGLPPVHLTGYLEGVVTINMIEADDTARDRIRGLMGEPYRTLVGHFRHELGHHFWRPLVDGRPPLADFRGVFGDERADYLMSAAAYYQAGAPEDWSDAFVSRYAAMHPWEDFAETFAHFLHIVDVLALASDFGMTMASPEDGDDAPMFRSEVDLYAADTASLISLWGPCAHALNAFSRCMGQPDLYPFALSPAVAVKLDFVNRLVAAATGRAPFGGGDQAGFRAMIAVLALKAAPEEYPA